MSDLRAPDESCTHGLPEGAGMLGRRPYCPPSAVPTYMRTSHSFCSLPDLPDLRVVTLFSLKATALNSSGASSGGLKSMFSRSWATPNPVRPPDTTYLGTAFFGFASSSSSA